MNRSSRRDILRLGLFTSLAAGAARASTAAADRPAGAASGLLVRSTRPLDLETPVSAFTEELTPNELFFVRSHFGAPAIDPAGYGFRVEGMVDRPRELTLADLRKLPRTSAAAVLQCAGNGRALFKPRVAGAQWERGAVGQALWGGVRLADVLKIAGVQGGAKWVTFLPGDHPMAEKVPPFLRSIPLSKAGDDVLLAWEMNRVPLPPLHGAPLRAIVPGWAGAHWVKWLRGIRVDDQEDKGFYMQTAYKFPTAPLAPGATPGEMKSVTTLGVKSLIARPLEGAVLRPGAARVQGVAFGGTGPIARLEVSLDGGATWREARLDRPRDAFAWQRFRYAWDARPGLYTVRPRATDTAGETQPAEPRWNPGGYLYNAWDAVRCEVRA